MNLRELNHIFIPRSAETWERLERSPLVRPFRPLLEWAASLTTEGQVVFVAMLVSGAAGIDVRFSHLYLVFCGLVGLLVSAFVCRPMAFMTGVTLRVDHPPRVASGEVTTFTLTLRNEGPRAAYAVRVRGPFLPWDGAWVGAMPAVPCLEPGKEARVVVSGRFLMRGQRRLGRFFAQSVQPLSLMGGRPVRAEPVRLTVVPRVPRVFGLGPPRASPRFGDRAARAQAAGDSFELLGVRPYRPGDRIRDLHARSWARVGEPIVREYRRPALERVAVVLDPRSGRVSRELFDAAVELAAGLVARLTGAELQVDLLIAAEPTVRVRVAGGGVLEPALDALAAVEPARRGAAAESLAAQAAGSASVHVVLLRWDSDAAALLAQLRRASPEVRAFLVVSRGDGPEAARALGVRVVRRSDVARGAVSLA